MTDAEDKEKAEKLAAAKKRFEQLKKQKGTKAGGKKKDTKSKEPSTNGAKDENSTSEADGSKPKDGDDEAEKVQEVEAEAEDKLEEEDPTKTGSTEGDAPKASKPTRTPSLSVQSRIRSSSFRKGSISQGPLSPQSGAAKSPTLPLLSPEGDAVTDIYRKQASRIEELETESRRLANEFADGEIRWKKATEEVEELRESKGDLAAVQDRAKKVEAQEAELTKLKSEIASLQRQNTHLQSQTSRSSRHASSPSQSHPASTTSSELSEALKSKSDAVESMEMEISNLRAQLEKTLSSSSGHDEQVGALEARLERSEKSAESAQRELVDLKKNLDRTSERAVKEGSQRTSAETKVRTLERELQESKKHAEEVTKKCEGLEKKVEALAKLHKESDARSQAQGKERDRYEKEASELRTRLASMDNQLLSLREEKEKWKRQHVDGGEDDGVDDLEDEHRTKLQRRVRELESEVFELRRGVWKDRRKELEADGIVPGPEDQGFDDIDLGASTTQMSPGQRPRPSGQGLSSVFSGGFSALTGGGAPRPHTNDDNDDDFAFDEDAFRRAQEEEARLRVERIKEVKRGLKQWEGWQLDLVEQRMAGGGAGEIFDV